MTWLWNNSAYRNGRFPSTSVLQEVLSKTHLTWPAQILYFTFYCLLFFSCCFERLLWEAELSLYIYVFSWNNLCVLYSCFWVWSWSPVLYLFCILLPCISFHSHNKLTLWGSIKSKGWQTMAHASNKASWISKVWHHLLWFSTIIGTNWFNFDAQISRTGLPSMLPLCPNVSLCSCQQNLHKLVIGWNRDGTVNLALDLSASHSSQWFLFFSC